MKYLLVNDTSHTNNPGCRGTVACLRELLRHGGLEEHHSLPVDFGAELFFGASESFGKSDSLRQWIRAKRRLRKKLPISLADFDMIIVNGEGTVHHNKPGALAILAIIDTAADLSVPVFFVNGTVQAMNPALMTEVLSRCEALLIREGHSREYLKSLGIDSKLAPDCLFTFFSNRDPRPSSTLDSSCLYTPGVQCLTGELKEDDVAFHLHTLHSQGYSVTYLVAETEDEQFAKTASQAGAKIIGIADIPWFSLTEFLSDFSLTVSGRYHMCIYSWMAQVPVVPMKSNTWKMEALFSLAECVTEPLFSEFPDRIQSNACLPDFSTIRCLASQCQSAFAATFK